jgi:3-oxoacyl-[acyl-carrier protein] reductase
VKQKLKIDILVNNAGVAHGGLFQMTSLDTVKAVFETNFFSFMKLSQLVARPMIQRKSGAIINMASISGMELRAGNVAYGTSKAAVIALTKTMSAELAPLGIRVNAVAPGLTDTDMAKQMEESAGQAMVQASSLNRLAKPEEIANAVLFLASGDAGFVTGEVLTVDGGRV